jgi:peptidoglycan/LPS O-acetylase OafA/YrhL
MPTRPSPSPGPADLTVDALVDATPASRDRTVDLLRAVSICVVVVWHWTFSILHWRRGALTMPNPIGDVPGLWAATWLLQVMPLFFLVGGYANLAGWEATVRRGGDARDFLAKRFSRLMRPVAVYVLVWAVVDLAWQAGGGRSVLEWGLVVFVPLWFLGVYAGVVLLVPVTARLHAARRGTVLVALGAGIALADLARVGPGVGWAGLAGSALVWLFCHQLGYWWRDGSLVRGGRRAASALVAAGLAGLTLLTGLGPYSRSMVAISGEQTSNMFPTTACIAALAVLQLGVVLVVRPHLDAWLQRRGAWRAVVAANGVAMTVFCWHMTALVAFLGLYQASGLTLADRATAGWWLARPLWLLGPGVVLATLVAGLSRFERQAGG